MLDKLDAQAGRERLLDIGCGCVSTLDDARRRRSGARTRRGVHDLARTRRRSVTPASRRTASKTAPASSARTTATSTKARSTRSRASRWSSTSASRTSASTARRSTTCSRTTGSSSSSGRALRTAAATLRGSACRSSACAPEDPVWGLFMAKYIFPGRRRVAHAERHVRASSRKAGFEIQSVGERQPRTTRSRSSAGTRTGRRTRSQVLKTYGERWYRSLAPLPRLELAASPSQGNAACFQILANKNLDTFNRKVFINNNPARRARPLVGT